MFKRKGIVFAAVLLALLLIAPSLSFSASAGYKLGNVSGSGEIDANDARMVLRYVAKLQDLTPEQLEAADLNGDGVIDAGIARLILRHVAKIELIVDNRNPNSESNTEQKPADTKPTDTKPTEPNKPGLLPDSVNSAADAVQLYQEALNKARNASGFTAKKIESANMNIETGKKVFVFVTINVDEFFRNFISAKRETDYQYGGGAWSLHTYKTIPKTLGSGTEPLDYKEYGDNSSVSYKDDKYYNFKQKTASYGPSELAPLLREHDPLKMANVSSPSNFLPPADFSANDVVSYSYNKGNDGRAVVVLDLAPSAMINAMYIPDTVAMCANPYVHNTIIDITMTFHEFITDWQNPRLEMNIDAYGYPTLIKHTADLGSGSKGSISVSPGGIDNVSSGIAGDFAMGWALGNWNHAERPEKPF
ncbi:MAG: dockerin type I repeat-containing protein [Oscillospiraceae bacterium]|nr:dockerin type I repeat-containing protein [Oscillospiraceae bacterium]